MFISKPHNLHNYSLFLCIFGDQTIIQGSTLANFLHRRHESKFKVYRSKSFIQICNNQQCKYSYEFYGYQVLLQVKQNYQTLLIHNEVYEANSFLHSHLYIYWLLNLKGQVSNFETLEMRVPKSLAPNLTNKSKIQKFENLRRRFRRPTFPKVRQKIMELPRMLWFLHI